MAATRETNRRHEMVYLTVSKIQMIDCFHVVDGQILSIRVYYDPRPILEV